MVRVKQAVMRVLIEIERNVLLEGSLEFPPKIADKLRDPAVVLVVFLTVRNKYVVLKARDYRRHGQR
jgi:hypothetical protein